VAIVGPVRDDLLIVDIDSCADQVMDQVIAAAVGAGAIFGYLTASGSPNSRHVGFAVTPAIRAAASTAIDTVRRRAGLSALAVDVRLMGEHLRYPGSASLKGTARCMPVDVDGTPITAVAATARLDAALDELAAHHEPAPEAASAAPATALTAVPSPAPPTNVDANTVDVDEPEEIGRWDLEPERAWRAPTPITAEGYKVLDREVDPALRARIDEARKSGKRASRADEARWDRENGSRLATDGAWVVYRSGIKSWRLARHYYRRHRCFAKFAQLDTAARAAGADAHHCFKHWQSIKEHAERWRRELPADEAAFIARVLDEISHWDDPTAVAAAAHVVHHRFSDGHGTHVPRPIAERTLALWLSVSQSTARKWLAVLVERGLLTLEIPHDRRASRHEAHCYQLHVPSSIYRTDSVHDITAGGSYTHPLWGDLGQRARHTYDQLSASPLSTSDVALRTHQSPGTASHGALRQLKLLEQHGLATRHGHGAATTWTRGQGTLDQAAAAVGTEARTNALRATINTERKAWHATSYRTSAAARTRLAYLTRRQHSATHGYPEQAPPAAPVQLALIVSPGQRSALATSVSVSSRNGQSRWQNDRDHRPRERPR
jgi:DNA-binding transcriptional ArsR family regulator